MTEDRAIKPMTIARESVRDYPRPPRLEPTGARLLIVFAGQTVAETVRAFRVLETSHPPTYYLPPEDVRLGFLYPAAGGSLCEFKGRAVYWTVEVNGRRAEAAAWSYPNPTEVFLPIKDHLAFYPSAMDACFVDGERVRPQDGDFYGGWITSSVAGPFKGAPGTLAW